MQKKLKVTSIIISHDIESTFEMADFVAMLHEGKIIAQGSPEEFRKSPHPFVRKFLKGKEA
jgi:phospholipid/cholesterol/gamma-HCH transport system ATP-binding protein